MLEKLKNKKIELHLGFLFGFFIIAYAFYAWSLTLKQSYGEVYYGHRQPSVFFLILLPFLFPIFYLIGITVEKIFSKINFFNKFFQKIRLIGLSFLLAINLILIDFVFLRIWRIIYVAISYLIKCGGPNTFRSECELLFHSDRDYIIIRQIPMIYSYSWKSDNALTTIAFISRPEILIPIIIIITTSLLIYFKNCRLVRLLILPMNILALLLILTIAAGKLPYPPFD